ncbi:VOC family protein [Streptomyces sp. NPDC058307]|uniref:VOC family protein n=1 Tax=Streptomyces sp. NPDC058307 TaxID=3346439 RepID=UPI0036F0BD71
MPGIAGPRRSTGRRGRMDPVKSRLHLDFRSDDQAAEVARLAAHGAQRVDLGQGDQSWVVMADPEGNEFCVLGQRRR